MMFAVPRQPRQTHHRLGNQASFFSTLHFYLPGKVMNAKLMVILKVYPTFQTWHKAWLIKHHDYTYLFRINQVDID